MDCETNKAPMGEYTSEMQNERRADFSSPDDAFFAAMDDKLAFAVSAYVAVS